MAESEVTKCPKCGAQMEKGVIGAWYIFWSTRRKDVFWRSPPKQDLIARPGWTAKNYTANRCSKCQLILFDYDHEAPVEQQETPKSFLKNCVQCGKELPIASEHCPHCGKKQPKHAKRK